MIEQLIAEATECDFKVALETKKPKSWLKSVSAFSNGIGGTLFFGVSDDREPIGLSDVQKDAEAISRLIKERITPLPQFILKPLQEDGKNLLALEVSPGRSTPLEKALTLFNQLFGFFVSRATLKSHSVASAMSCSIIKSLL